jgi:ABC-type sugar transport system substrate-binding protein
MASRLAATVWLAGVLALGGCGGEVPPLEDLGLDDGASSPGGVVEVAMIFPSRHSPEHNLWEPVFSGRIGQARMIFTPEHDEPGEPPERQAERIRAAVERGVSALVVVPGDPAVLAPALADARAKGVKVVVLGGEVPVEGGPPLPTVVQPPPEGTAAELVAAALKAAKEAKPPLVGPALLLRPESPDDPRIPRRVAALKAELAKAGIEVLPERTFRIEGKQAQEAVEAAIAEGLRPSMIFGLDDTALTSAARARGALLGKADFILAGYLDNPDMMAVLRTRMCTAAVDGNLRAAAEEGVRLTLDLLDGREVPARVDVPTPLKLAEGPPRANPYARPPELFPGTAAKPVD